MPGAGPDSHVAVIIPYGGGDQAGLERQIEALRAQVTDYAFTVTVAANSESAMLEASSLAEHHRSGISMGVVDATARPGPSYARNIGWMSTRSAKILFCDADDLVPQDWVRMLADGLETFDVVGSDIVQTPPPGGLPGVVRLVRAPIVKDHAPKYFGSCSVGMRRDVLEQLQGWDEALTAAEDIDLCYRAALSGFSLGRADSDPVVYMMRGSFSEVYRQFRAYGRGDIALDRKHRLGTAVWRRFRPSFVGAIVILSIASISSRYRRTLASKLGLASGWLSYGRGASEGHVRGLISGRGRE